MKSKILRVVFPLIMIVAMLLPAVAAAASLRLFSVVESAHNNYAQLPVIVPISNTGLVAQGKIASDGLNTVVSLNGTAMPRMIADDKTLFASPILADSTNNFVYSNKVIADSSMPIIVGTGGYITTPYNVDLEPLGNDFSISFPCYINTSSGSNKYLLYHDGEITIQVTDTEEITLTVYDGSTHTDVITGIPSGHYAAVSLVRSGGTVTLTIGAYSCAVTGIGTIPDNNVDWIWNENNAMPYIDSITIDETPSIMIQHNDASPGGGSQFGIGWWFETQFQASSTYAVTSVSLYLSSYGWTDGDVVVSVRSTQTGADLCSGTIPPSAVPNDSLTYAWVNASMGSGAILTSGNTYYICIRNPTGSFNTNYLLGESGALVNESFSNDSGATWGGNVGSTAYRIYASSGMNEVLKYQPNEIIAGTVLPDRDFTEDGVITWGTNPAGIAVTNLSAPNVTTDAATNILTTSATLNGTLNDLGGYSSVVVSFEYGLETTPQTYPNTISVSPALTILQSFPASITNLQPNATYHYQAIANVGGIVIYGGDQSFKTTLSATSSTTVTISRVGVFQDYTADGDMLFTAEIFCNYPPYNQQGSAFKFFNVELTDTDGTTVIAVSPLMMWGDRPESIYLKPSIASTLTLNAPYHIKVVGVFSGAANPYATYTILPDDWNGSDKIQLDAWCIEVAKDMEFYDSKAVGTYVVSSTDNKEVITDTAGASGYNEGAGGYFTMGIPQISVVRPDLFQVTKSKAPVVLNSSNNVYDSNHVWASQVGSQIASDFNTFGSLIFGDSLHGASVMGYLLLLVAVVICVMGIGLGGKGLPLLVLSFPLILWGTEMGAIGIQWLLVPCVAMVMLWARQFWVKPT